MKERKHYNTCIELSSIAVDMINVVLLPDNHSDQYEILHDYI